MKQSLETQAQAQIRAASSHFSLPPLALGTTLQDNATLSVIGGRSVELTKQVLEQTPAVPTDRLTERLLSIPKEYIDLTLLRFPG